MSFDYSGFEALMKGDINDIPKIEFKPGTFMQRVQDTIMGKLRLSSSWDSDNQMVIDDVLEEMSKVLCDSDHSYIFTELDKAGAQLAQEFKRADNIVNNQIFEQVEVLAKDIREEANEYLRKNGAEVLISDNEKPSADFNTISWGSLKNGSYAYTIVDAAHKLANIKGTKVSRVNCSLVFNVAKRPMFSEVQLKSDNLDYIIDEVDKVLPRRNREEVASNIAIFFNQVAYTTFIGRLQREFKETKDMGNFVATLLDKVDLLTYMGKALSNVSYELPENTVAKIYDNLKAVKETTFCLEYVTYWCKDWFKDAIMITPNLINGDNYPKFTHKGGDNHTLAYYLRLIIKDKPFPSTGINMTQVLSSKDALRDEIEKHESAMKSDLTLIKKKSLIYASELVLRKEMFEIATSKGEKTSEDYKAVVKKHERVINSLRGLLNPNTANLEDVLYKYIVATQYSGTLVERVYEVVSDAVVKHASDDNSIVDKSSESKIKCQVILDLVSEHLLKTYCK